MFDERVAELTACHKLKKTLKEGETDEGITKEEYSQIICALNHRKPVELQYRVFVHCGAWFSWRGGHYYRFLSEVTGPHCDNEGISLIFCHLVLATATVKQSCLFNQVTLIMSLMSNLVVRTQRTGRLQFVSSNKTSSHNQAESMKNIPRQLMMTYIFTCQNNILIELTINIST